MRAESVKFNSPVALAELWRWSLQCLDLQGACAPSADQFVATYLQGPKALLDPLPLYFFEIHFPEDPGLAHHVDLYLMKWMPNRLRRTAQVWQAAPMLAPGLRVYSQHQFAEFDFEENHLKPMGVFSQVSNLGQRCSFQGQVLNQISALLGPPQITGLIFNRGAWGRALEFWVLDASQWHQAMDILVPQLGDWLRAFAGLYELIKPEIDIMRILLLVNPDGQISPRLGLAMFGLQRPSPKLLAGLCDFGVSASVMDAWVQLDRRLPTSEELMQPLIPEFPMLCYPSHIRRMRVEHTKLTLQPGKIGLKSYVRVNIESAQLPLLRRNLNKLGFFATQYDALFLFSFSARCAAIQQGGDNADDEWKSFLDEIPLPAQNLPFKALAWAIVRYRWNLMVDQLPAIGLSDMDAAVQDRWLIMMLIHFES